MLNPSLETLTVRDVLPQDIKALHPIMEASIKDSYTGLPIHQEIDMALEAISAAAEGTSDRLYVVAEAAGGSILGVMGLVTASELLDEVAPSVATGTAGELINAFVDPAARGQGVGKQLVKHLEFSAKRFGYEDIVVASGPRYKTTGWPFWTSLYGQPAWIFPDAYGPGNDAPVWRKKL